MLKILDRSQLPLQFYTWEELDLHTFVHWFIYFRFPTVLACNKIDKIAAAVSAKHGGPGDTKTSVVHSADVESRLAIIRERSSVADCWVDLVPVSAKLGMNVVQCMSSAVGTLDPVYVTDEGTGGMFLMRRGIQV